MAQAGTQFQAIQGGKEPPGPQGNFLLGSLPGVRRDILGFLVSVAREYGDIAHIRVAMNHIYLVSHPDYIKHVLVDANKNYNKRNFNYERLKPVVGEGLLTSDGETWLRQRRLIQPAFHRQRIQGFASMMAQSTTTMLDRWEPAARQGEVLDIAAEMMRLTLTIVSLALFSRDASGEADLVGKAFTLVNQDTSDRFRTVLAAPLSWPTPRNRRFHAAMRTLDQVVDSIIFERRALLDAGETPPADLLTMLLQAREEGSQAGMDDRTLRDEVMTLMLAGHETTATALAWTFYLLSQNPEAWDQLHAENRMVLAGRVPTLADLAHLPYNRMVIEESMRLYPPAWIISRNTVADDVLGGYRIPAGMSVNMSPYVTHRHPEFWPQPEKFDPQRFAPGAADQRPPFAYFPFGGGPRLCIGRDFALLEAQLILAMVTQRFRLCLAPGQQVVPEPMITLRPLSVRMTLAPGG